MNSDIRLSVTFPDNPKIIRLERKLDAQAVLALLRLWLWASANRPSGILVGMDPEDVEIAARWRGEAGAFVKTLLELRLLDEISGDKGLPSVLQIHDWEEHNSWQSREKMRQERARTAALAKWERRNAQAVLKQCDSNALGSAPNLPEPNPTEPTRTEPNQKNKSTPQAGTPPAAAGPSPDDRRKDRRTRVARAEAEDYLSLFPETHRNDDQFREAWFAWRRHRKEKRCPITETTAKLQAKKLGQEPPEIARRILERSIENGWQGLFPLPEEEMPEPSIQPQAPLLGEARQRELRMQDPFLRQIQLEKDRAAAGLPKETGPPPTEEERKATAEAFERTRATMDSIFDSLGLKDG